MKKCFITILLVCLLIYLIVDIDQNLLSKIWGRRTETTGPGLPKSGSLPVVGDSLELERERSR